MIRLNGISKYYLSKKEKTEALKEISLGFGERGLTAVLGPSGSGKTTLLNIIGGILPTSSGEMEVDGISTASFRESDWVRYRGKTVGYVFQENYMFSYLTVYENMLLAMNLAGIDRKEREERASALLAEVGLLRKKNKKPGELSRGELQRAAVSRAMVSHPDILLADEPTESLDRENRQIMMALLKRAAENCLVIMVTHDSEMAEKYADRIIEIREGLLLSDRENRAEEEAPLLELIGADAEPEAEVIRNSVKEVKGRGRVSGFFGKISMNRLLSYRKVLHEAALLRALGASTGQVMLVFLLKNVLVSLLAGTVLSGCVLAGLQAFGRTVTPWFACTVFAAAVVLILIAVCAYTVFAGRRTPAKGLKTE